MPWFGRRLKAGDRYDAYGLVVGLIAFVILGLILQGTSKSPVAPWLISFGIGAGITNVTSFILRRTVGPGPPPDARNDHGTGQENRSQPR
jgi:hypothetical protein